MMRTRKTTPAEEDTATSSTDRGPGAERGDALPEDSEVSDGQDAPARNDLVAELQAKVESLEDALLRAKADLQNLQRRAGVEKAEAIRYANADLMRSLLGVLDDLERSFGALDCAENVEAVKEGVRLVQANLLKALSEQGLEPIEALFEPFDPNNHEALLRQPSAEHDPNTVIEQVARGYRLRDRVLRPAKVIVSQPGESRPAPSTDSPDTTGSRNQGSPGE